MNIVDTFNYTPSWGNGCPYDDPVGAVKGLPGRWKGEQFKTTVMKKGVGGHLQVSGLDGLRALVLCQLRAV